MTQRSKLLDPWPDIRIGLDPITTTTGGLIGTDDIQSLLGPRQLDAVVVGPSLLVDGLERAIVHFDDLADHRALTAAMSPSNIDNSHVVTLFECETVIVCIVCIKRILTILNDWTISTSRSEERRVGKECRYQWTQYE